MMTPFRLAGIGEILWDILPDSETLGGAPANFAYHVHSLGAKSAVISTVGNDARGIRSIEILRDKGVDTTGITFVDEHPTGYVSADLDENGIATYNFPADVAWDHLSINEPAQAKANRLDGVCFGTLAQRSAPTRSAIHRFLGLLPTGALRIYDLNLRQNFYSKEIIDRSLQLSSILKLNDDELDVLAQMFELNGADTNQLGGLLRHYHLDLAILTRGAHGSILLTADEHSDHPGIAVEIADTIGAGDSFTAATVLGFLQSRPLDEINATANRLAAYVCSQPGAMPEIPARLGYGC